MSRPRFALLVCPFLLLLTLMACSRAPQPAETQQATQILAFSGPTMGSTYHIQYVATANTPPATELQQQTEALLAQLDGEVSTYRNDSAVALFNRAAAGHCRTMPASVITMVQAGEVLSEASGGAYDLTLGTLLDLWGFGAAKNGGSTSIPDAEQRQQALAHTGYRHLHIRHGNQLCKDIDLQLNFNSLAAGYAIDQVAAYFTSAGVDSYLIEITGELKARGHKPDGSPWHVAIEAPADSAATDAQQLLVAVNIDGQGMSTSGDYRAFHLIDGKRYSHTLDPRTGAPTTHSLASVTVIHPSAMQADALSTLLLVQGFTDGYDYAVKNGLVAFFVIRSDSHDGNSFVSAASPAFSTMKAQTE